MEPRCNSQCENQTSLRKVEGLTLLSKEAGELLWKESGTTILLESAGSIARATEVVLRAIVLSERNSRVNSNSSSMKKKVAALLLITLRSEDKQRNLRHRIRPTDIGTKPGRRTTRQ